MTAPTRIRTGENIQRVLWISGSCARNGADKHISVGGQVLTMVVPPHSRDGLTVRLRGYGKQAGFDLLNPFARRVRGNALVKLIVYPDTVVPRYGFFDALTTEDMALEGWVYAKIEEVTARLGRGVFPDHPMSADTIADLFNEQGWTAIFFALVRHLGLGHIDLELKRSHALDKPGTCQRTVTQEKDGALTSHYVITVQDQFVENPFAVAAILAHELCHVLYCERLDGRPLMLGGLALESAPATLEEERTVDLLAFMYKIGEFQLRVARDTSFTLGYFHQDVFERMQIIVSKKLGPLI
jgi:hypothetical protein